MAALLSVRDLACTPPGAPGPAFQGLAFEVGSGETAALLGPAGSGKSTALRILAGLLRDYAGAVDFEGKELKDWSRDFFLRIGAALEAPLLQDGLTARENLEFAAGLHPAEGPNGKPREAVPALLERLDLGAAASRRASRLDEEDRRKLSLARAFLHRPDLLILDDPFRGLSARGITQVTSLLEAHRQGGGAAVLACRSAPDGVPALRGIPLPVSAVSPAGSR